MTKSISVTREQLTAFKPCDPDSRLRLFGRRKAMTATQALAAGASIRDVLWVLGKMGRKDLCVRFALLSAQRVAHLNSDPRAQTALDATRAWLDDPTEEKRLAARKAAYAAVAAAAAAADAADAAVAAAAAAADAADAAAYAAADARKQEIDAQHAILIAVCSGASQ